jgi:hypothetical protein
MTDNVTRIRTFIASLLITWGIRLMPDAAWITVESVHDHLLGKPL